MKKLVFGGAALFCVNIFVGELWGVPVRNSNKLTRSAANLQIHKASAEAKRNSTKQNVLLRSKNYSRRNYENTTATIARRYAITTKNTNNSRNDSIILSRVIFESSLYSELKNIISYIPSKDIQILMNNMNILSRDLPKKNGQKDIKTVLDKINEALDCFDDLLRVRANLYQILFNQKEKRENVSDSVELDQVIENLDRVDMNKFKKIISMCEQENMSNQIISDLKTLWNQIKKSNTILTEFKNQFSTILLSQIEGLPDLENLKATDTISNRKLARLREDLELNNIGDDEWEEVADSDDNYDYEETSEEDDDTDLENYAVYNRISGSYAEELGREEDKQKKQRILGIRKSKIKKQRQDEKKNNRHWIENADYETLDKKQKLTYPKSQSDHQNSNDYDYEETSEEDDDTDLENYAVYNRISGSYAEELGREEDKQKKQRILGIRKSKIKKKRQNETQNNQHETENADYETLDKKQKLTYPKSNSDNRNSDEEDDEKWEEDTNALKISNKIRLKYDEGGDEKGEPKYNLINKKSQNYKNQSPADIFRSNNHRIFLKNKTLENNSYETEDQEEEYDETEEITKSNNGKISQKQINNHKLREDKNVNATGIVDLNDIDNLNNFYKFVEYNVSFVDERNASNKQKTQLKKIREYLKETKSERNFEQKISDVDRVIKSYNSLVHLTPKTKNRKNLLSIKRAKIKYFQQKIYLEIFDSLSSRIKSLKSNKKFKKLGMQKEFEDALEDNENNKKKFIRSLSVREKRQIMNNSAAAYDKLIEKIWKYPELIKSKADREELDRIGYTLDSVILSINV